MSDAAPPHTPPPPSPAPKPPSSNHDSSSKTSFKNVRPTHPVAQSFTNDTLCNQHHQLNLPMPQPTAAIATPHPDAARAARLAIEQGGNAIDAAAAAMLTLCVV